MSHLDDLTDPASVSIKDDPSAAAMTPDEEDNDHTHPNPTTSTSTSTSTNPLLNPTNPLVSDLEQEVLDEYARLLGNVNALSTKLADLAGSPASMTLDGLRHLERKTATVCTLLKASVYSIVLQQQMINESEGQHQQQQFAGQGEGHGQGHGQGFEDAMGYEGEQAEQGYGYGYYDEGQGQDVSLLGRF